MHFKSLFFIVFVVFCMTQTSAQTCQDTFSLKNTADPQNEVVSGPPPKTPLPIPANKPRSYKRFLTAYNKGEFVGDERYIGKYFSLGGRIAHYYNYRITGLEDGALIVDYIDGRTGSIESTQIRPRSIFNPLHLLSVREQSKDMFYRVEQSLAEVNFDSKNKKGTKGNKMDRLIFIGSQLRNSPRVNPYKTHIVDFEDQITEHIEFIRQGILSSETDIDSKLEILSAFKQEAESKRDNKELTYQYWLLWNMRLSILVSSKKPNWDWKTHKGALLWEDKDGLFLLSKNKDVNYNNYAQNVVDFFLEMFPRYIVLPTIGPLEYKDLNKTFSDDTFLIELQNKNTVQDKQEMFPYELYSHDLNHNVLSTYERISLPNMGNSRFSKRYLKIAESFPDKIREMAEIGHFIFFHETLGLLKPRSNIKKFFEKNNVDHNNDIYTRLLDKENDLGAILPEDVRSEKEVKKYFKRVSDVFNRIYLQILVDGYAEEPLS